MDTPGLEGHTTGIVKCFEVEKDEHSKFSFDFFRVQMEDTKSSTLLNKCSVY